MALKDTYLSELQDYWGQLESFGYDEEEIGKILMPTGAIPQTVRTREIERLERRAEEAIESAMEYADEESEDILDSAEEEKLINFADELDVGVGNVFDAVYEWGTDAIKGMDSQEREEFFDELENTLNNTEMKEYRYHPTEIQKLLSSISAFFGQSIPTEIVNKIELAVMVQSDEISATPNAGAMPSLRGR